MSVTRYSDIAIALHWLIAALLIGQLIGGLYMVEIPDEQTSWKFQVFQLHKSFGITILLLTAVRLIWRLTHQPPALPAAMPVWERLAARTTHVGFYVLLIVIPLLGWAYVSTAPLNVPTVLFGIIPLPHMPFFEGVQDSKEIAELFEESHEIAAKLVIALIALHVAAALKHHFIDKDDVLARMLPLLRTRRR